MVVISNFSFGKKITEPFESKDYSNSIGDVMTIEVGGTFSDASIVIEGKADFTSEEYTPFTSLDLMVYDVHEKITAPGIYEIAIEGIQFIRARVESVSGGYVTILGRAVNSAS